MSNVIGGPLAVGDTVRVPEGLPRPYRTSGPDNVGVPKGGEGEVIATYPTDRRAMVDFGETIRTVGYGEIEIVGLVGAS